MLFPRAKQDKNSVGQGGGGQHCGHVTQYDSTTYYDDGRQARIRGEFNPGRSPTEDSAACDDLSDDISSHRDGRRDVTSPTVDRSHWQNHNDRRPS